VSPTITISASLLLTASGELEWNSAKKGTYGSSDLGPDAIKAYLKKHKCNDVCKGLGLDHVEDDFDSDFDF